MASGSDSHVIDYLDEDRPIRGQNYVCLSFVSPEDVIANKEVYTFGRFMGSLSKDLGIMLENLKQKYPEEADMFNNLRSVHSHWFEASELQEQYRFFKSVNGADLDSEFVKEHGPGTSVRGIKVRGVFDTVDEAKNRAEFLKKMGDKFDIFIGQVGLWCPWSPNPEEIRDVKYMNEQLNQLVGKYRENLDLKDEFFAQRKEESIKAAKAEADRIREKNKQPAASSSAQPPLPLAEGAVSEVAAGDVMAQSDPWTAAHPPK